jgi:hypothetical protein
MTAEEIAAIMAMKMPDPLEPVFSVTTLDALKVLADQLGSEALFLTDAEIASFRSEVQAVFCHYTHEQELYGLAMENWQVSRTL